MRCFRERQTDREERTEKDREREGKRGTQREKERDNNKQNKTDRKRERENGQKERKYVLYVCVLGIRSKLYTSVTFGAITMLLYNGTIVELMF